MKIENFTQKIRLNKKDSDICKAVYKNREMSEEQWQEELKDKVVLPSTEKKAKKQSNATPREATMNATEVPDSKAAAKAKIETIKSKNNQK